MSSIFMEMQVADFRGKPYLNLVIGSFITFLAEILQFLHSILRAVDSQRVTTYPLAIMKKMTLTVFSSISGK